MCRVQSCHRSPWRRRRGGGCILQDQRLSHQVLHFHLRSYRVPRRLQETTSTQEARPAAKMTTAWWRTSGNPETQNLKNWNLKGRQAGPHVAFHEVSAWPLKICWEDLWLWCGTPSSWIESFPSSCCSFFAPDQINRLWSREHVLLKNNRTRVSFFYFSTTVTPAGFQTRRDCLIKAN